MIDWFRDAHPLTHTIAALLLVGRIGDILSTRLVTPTLRLEANPVMRRLGWRFAWTSLLLALLPYYSPGLGIAAVAASLLVAASNLSRGWIYHALGETASDEFLLQVAAKTRQAPALAFVLGGGVLTMLAGALLMWLSGSSGVPGYWFGAGIVIYGLAIAVHGSVFVLRLIRRARARAPAI